MRRGVQRSNLQYSDIQKRIKNHQAQHAKNIRNIAFEPDLSRLPEDRRRIHSGDSSVPYMKYLPEEEHGTCYHRIQSVYL